MPNYCFNRLEIDGAEDELDALAKAVAIEESDDRNDLFSYVKVIAVSPGEDEGEAWGSTSVYCLKVRRKRGELIYEFESSWDPPHNVITELARQWPDLRFDFTYCEPLTGRYGSRHLADGESHHWSDGIARWWSGEDEVREFLEDEWPELAAKWYAGEESADQDKEAAA